MTLRDRVRRLNHWQQTTPFKIGASVLLVILAVVFIAYQALDIARSSLDAQAAPDAAAVEPDRPPTQDVRDAGGAYALSPQAATEMLEAASDPTTAILSTLLLLGVSLAVVWLGLTLVALAFCVVSAIILTPLTLFERTQSLALIFAGVLVLAASFSVLLQVARAALSGPGPVTSIARNVLAEAARLRLSVVLLVALGFGLAALPGLLDNEMALRYRVQSFLQYGTGGSYWIIALLIALFSVSTVAFEQRDKLIWQTMTKPVAPWKYVFGKWLGVVTLAAVLLGVCATGVFLFTEHLRGQKAVGEIAPFRAEYGEISEDRLLLESQVLVALRTVKPDYLLPGDEVPISRESPRFQQGLATYLEEQRRREPMFARLPNGEDDPETVEEVARDLFKQVTMMVRTLPPPMARQVTLPDGGWYFEWRPYENRTFKFSGLQDAASKRIPLTMTYKIEAGVNNPTHFYRLDFAVNRRTGDEDGISGVTVIPAPQVPLSTRQTLTIPSDAIDEKGDLYLSVVSYGLLEAPEASEAVTFDEESLAVLVNAGGWRMNFLRAMVILWCKIAALAMLCITLATFLSFQVACLVVFVVFVAAEGSGYIARSLDNYATTDRQNRVILWKWAIAAIASTVTKIFSLYADLRPTTRLVEGRLLSWGSFAVGLTTLGAFTGAAFAVGVAALRRRELATYSGQ